MLKRFLIAALLVPLLALAQSYPSPTFNNLTVNGTISGAGLTSYLAAPPAIGGTTPNSGAFTSLSASGAVSGAGFSTYLASPPAIGGTAAASGAFTTLSASSTVSGTGFTSLLSPYALLASPTFTGTPAAPTASTGTNTTQIATTAFVANTLAAPPSIGNTTPNAGSFTTLAASSTITPSQTSGIVGTTTNNNANAGSVGEFVTATASSVALTSGTPTNVTSISLTAGDWEVSGNVLFAAGTGAAATLLQTSVSSTSGTITGGADNSLLGATLPAGIGSTLGAPVQRFSLSATTTIYLVAQANFSGGTYNATVRIRARRVR